jgi:hypothetical protein
MAITPIFIASVIHKNIFPRFFVLLCFDLFMATKYSNCKFKLSIIVLKFIKTIFQVKGNQNGYQASTTDVVIYNVRYIKIQSTENTDFCLRIELCGEG